MTISSLPTRMHIAYFTNTYLPMINGVTHSVNLFRQALTGLGHNVFIFCPEAGHYQDTEPFVFRYPAIKVSPDIDFAAAIPVSPFVGQLLPMLKLDVIHAHHPFLLGQTAAHRARELNVPLVFTFHTQYQEYSHYVPLPQDSLQAFIKRAIEARLGTYMQHCQHVVVPSQSMREALVEAYGLTGGITVIPTGIDLKPYRRADGRPIRQRRGWGSDPVVISTGRLAPEKNWRTLLDAMALVMPACPELRFALIGDGPEREALKAYARRLGMADRTEFVGAVPFAEVPGYLRAATLFAFASTTETQGLVTIEALAAGLPVVAVDATGTRDVIRHDQEGLLTRNDSADLAAAIQQVLDDPALAQRYRAAAVSRAQDFDIAYQTQRLLAVYRQAIEDKRANRSVIVTRHGKPFKLIDREPA
ncbi:MAG: glycosyltransferase [Anaerolineae bacterium]|nr:glycosyltransferase [Anaerolineae bacterium]